MDVARIILSGRLGTDFCLRKSQAGKEYLPFVVYSSHGKDNNGNEKTVVTQARLASSEWGYALGQINKAMPPLKKGDKVLIEGNLNALGRYNGKKGEVLFLDAWIDNIQCISRKQPVQQAYAPQPQAAPAPQYAPQAPAPQQQTAPQQQYAPQTAPQQQYAPQTAPQQQYAPQTAPQQQYAPQTAPQQQYAPQAQTAPAQSGFAPNPEGESEFGVF